MLLCYISHKLKISQMSQININWYVENVSFSSSTPERTFKLTEFTSLEDEIHHFLPYRDNRRIVKLECRSSSIANGWRIEFNKFELKTQADVRAMWNAYFHFKTKVLLELEAKISRSSKDIANMLKRPHGYWNNIAFYVEMIYAVLILFYES